MQNFSFFVFHLGYGQNLSPYAIEEFSRLLGKECMNILLY
jgi:hypothetical protein